MPVQSLTISSFLTFGSPLQQNQLQEEVPSLRRSLQVGIAAGDGAEQMDPSAAGQMPPRAAGHPSAAGQKPSRAGQKPPRAGQKPTGAGQVPPKAGQKPTGAGQGPPTGAGQEPPTAGQEPPKAVAGAVTDEDAMRAAMGGGLVAAGHGAQARAATAVAKASTLTMREFT